MVSILNGCLLLEMVIRIHDDYKWISFILLRNKWFRRYCFFIFPPLFVGDFLFLILNGNELERMTTDHTNIITTLFLCGHISLDF